MEMQLNRMPVIADIDPDKGIATIRSISLDIEDVRRMDQALSEDSEGKIDVSYFGAKGMVREFIGAQPISTSEQIDESLLSPEGGLYG